MVTKASASVTVPQLKQLLKWAIRYIDRENTVTRGCFVNPRTRRIEPRCVALEVAKTDMWLSKARKAMAKSQRAGK